MSSDIGNILLKRRRFLALVPATLGAGALSSVLGGCGANTGEALDGTVTVQNGQALVPFSQFPKLASVGGHVVVATGSGGRYIVIRTSSRRSARSLQTSRARPAWSREDAGPSSAFHRGIGVDRLVRHLPHVHSRPPVASELADLVRTMARANPLWGAPRIHGELLKLGLDVSQPYRGSAAGCQSPCLQPLAGAASPVPV